MQKSAVYLKYMEKKTHLQQMSKGLVGDESLFLIPKW